jgi:hypothetical protein
MAPVRRRVQNKENNIADVHSQHGSTLPQALTESAKAARMSFFCTEIRWIAKSITVHLIKRALTSIAFVTGELCQKGYARMNEFQAHESSYDHSHRMVRQLHHHHHHQHLPLRHFPIKSAINLRQTPS